jgi:hypothetical protein
MGFNSAFKGLMELSSNAINRGKLNMAFGTQFVLMLEIYGLVI